MNSNGLCRRCDAKIAHEIVSLARWTTPALPDPPSEAHLDRPIEVLDTGPLGGDVAAGAAALQKNCTNDAWPMPESGQWDPEQRCWLVWEVMTDGRSCLRSICTQQERAIRARTQLRTDGLARGVVSWFIEESRINHLFGSSIEQESSRR